MNSKKIIRSQIKERLKLISSDSIQEQSLICKTKLFNIDQFNESIAICSYLSMLSGEVQTYDLISAALSLNKRVFIPKVIGKNAQDMVAIEIFSFSEIESFPKNSWGIPEPPVEILNERPDGTQLGVIDLVIVPGVAFDSKCGRIGHGKGYYGNIHSL